MTLPIIAASIRCSATLADFDRLLAAAHERGLKLLLDFVPNHSSDQHPWFHREPLVARQPQARLVHLARPRARTAARPTTGSATSAARPGTWDEATGQYYLHAFLKEQPDLNWRNPDVRAAMLDVLRFWFDRGVDGFRIDVLWHIVKAEGLPDNPANPDYRPEMGEKHNVLQLHSTNQPEVHEHRGRVPRAGRQLWRPAAGRRDRPAARRADALLRPRRARACICRSISSWSRRRGTRPSLAQMIADYEAALPPGGWPNWVIGSHDYPRIAAKLGEAQARVAAMLLLTLRGTPTLYQGDELGIGKVAIPPDRVRDPQGAARARPRPRPRSVADADGLGRARPTPASARPSRGCRSIDDWPTRNVAAAGARSRLDAVPLPRRCCALRRAEPALSIGRFRAGRSRSDDVLAYERHHGDERLLVALNLSGSAARRLPAAAGRRTCSLSTLGSPPPDGWLRPDEGVVLRLADGLTMRVAMLSSISLAHAAARLRAVGAGHQPADRSAGRARHRRHPVRDARQRHRGQARWRRPARLFRRPDASMPRCGKRCISPICSSGRASST